jgi:hypothetical protein
VQPEPWVRVLITTTNKNNTWQILKFGAGEGWISVGPNVWEMKKYYKILRGKGISYIH